jgi:cytochrome b pre-mRNA-processing protein 3
MIFPLFRRSVRQDTISTPYGTIVAQARLACFYREYGVPDTLNGRFDLLVLHLATVLDRMAGDPSLRPLGQALFDQFCQDMDPFYEKWGSAIFLCRRKCAEWERHFTGGRRPTGRR